MTGVVPVDEFASALPARGRLIGLDLGTKTIGIGVSDVERRIASPLRTLKRAAFRTNADQLAAIFREFEIAGVVVGLPLDLEGRDNPRSQSARGFAHNLSLRADLPLALWDERFSTAVVTRSLIANDVSRARRAEVIDKMAAAYILQGALDRIRHAKRLHVGPE